MRRCLVALTAILACTSPLFAQQPKVLAPHRPIPSRYDKPIDMHQPAVLRSMFGGLWMTDANFKSSIYITSDLQTSAITVKPLLYLSNGKKLTLPDVKVEAAGIAVININDALNNLGISSWATLTGYVEIQYTWAWNPFCVTVTSVDVIHSTIFNYGLRPSVPPSTATASNPPTPPATQTIEGLWWKQEAGVTAFVALSNTSDQPMRAVASQ